MNGSIAYQSLCRRKAKLILSSDSVISSLETMMKPIIFFFSVIIAVIPIHGQDPLKAAPRSYKLEFENDLVKVMRVHYAAREKVPVHDHSRSPAAYVYLNDSGPINFRHTDWEHPVLRRPPVKAGSFRLSPTRFADETHEAENPNDTASDFLRIEFKFLPVAKTTVQGRFPREQIVADKGYSKVHFDNENVRVTREIIPQGQEIKLTSGKTEPALVVIVFAGPDRGEYEPGQAIWIGAGQERTIKNRTGAALEFLRFDLKQTGDRNPRGTEK
jgi:hypothetical protein